MVPQQMLHRGKSSPQAAGLEVNVGFETIWPRVSPTLLEMKCLRIKVIWAQDAANVSRTFPIQHAFPFPKLPG